MIGKQTHEQDRIVTELIGKSQQTGINPFKIGYLDSAVPSVYPQKPKAGGGFEDDTSKPKYASTMYASMRINAGTAKTECLFFDGLMPTLIDSNNVGAGFVVFNMGGVNYVLGKIYKI